MTLWRRPLQRIARRIGRLRDDREESGKQLQWFLLAGWRDRADWPRPEPAALTPIYPPDDAFWADPFAWSDAGRHFVFFEEYPFRSRLGRISCIELDRNARPVGGATPVIDEPWHLSYPFLLAFDGSLYMVPESSASKRIDLYRCVSFPFHWRRERTLIAGIRAADATLFEHDGRWWLFCAARLGRARLNDSLFAFHASSPLSDRWVPHERNPLVRDYERGRPAGRIFRDAGGTTAAPVAELRPALRVRAESRRDHRPVAPALRRAPCLAGYGTRGGRLAGDAPPGLARRADGDGRPAADTARLGLIPSFRSSGG